MRPTHFAGFLMAACLLAGACSDPSSGRYHVSGKVTFEGKPMPYRPTQPGEHYRLIVVATHAKVQQNRDVRDVLLSTGDLILRPDHYQEKDAPAAWRYYEILMTIRTELRSGK